MVIFVSMLLLSVFMKLLLLLDLVLGFRGLLLIVGRILSINLEVEQLFLKILLLKFGRKTWLPDGSALS